MRTPPTERRPGLVAVRLSEIPLRVRQDAYNRLLMGENREGIVVRSLSERVALGLAAETPSSTVYYVPRAAYERETRKRTWKLAAAKEAAS